jgi:hypothetical protein
MVYFMAEKTKELLNRSGTSPKKAQAKAELFVLTDAQWQQIFEVPGLPEARARGPIQKHIREYRNSILNSILSPPPTQAEIRKKFRDCATKLTAAIDPLKRDTLSTELYVYYCDDYWTPERIKRFLIDATGLAKLLKTVNVSPGKTGPDSLPIQFLVGKLSDVLTRYMGRDISLSEEPYGPDKKWNAAKYIYQTCKIADPGPKKSTIRSHILLLMKAIKEAKTQEIG